MAVQDASEDSAYALNQKYLLPSKNNTAKMPQNVFKIRTVGQTFPYPTGYPYDGKSPCILIKNDQILA